ncbi:hypothetical protein [Corynebacterium sp. H130]|uniref:hypothetical protein n=1 Tax=Corynebacterium sp. H130 TaxID=3133444 RepID=UPI0030A6B082
MSQKALLILTFGLQLLAGVAFFGFSDSVKTTNWLVAGAFGIVSGFFGIAYALKRKWDKASRFWFIIGSIGVMIGWGSWVYIAQNATPSDPIINITWFAATLGCFMQFLLASQKPAQGRR